MTMTGPALALISMLFMLVAPSNAGTVLRSTPAVPKDDQGPEWKCLKNLRYKVKQKQFVFALDKDEILGEDGLSRSEQQQLPCWNMVHVDCVHIAFDYTDATRQRSFPFHAPDSAPLNKENVAKRIFARSFRPATCRDITFTFYDKLEEDGTCSGTAYYSLVYRFS